jgi:hypothetical protein
MKFINRDQIDTKLWNSSIQNSVTENIFCYSWYLDATAKNWGALVTNNYKTILPIPYSKKLGVKQVYQPQFTRELDIFGTEFSWKEALSFLTNDFKGVQFRNENKNLLPHPEERKNQFLILSDLVAFSQNAKRMIKKSNQFSFSFSKDPSKLIQLFKNTTFSKIDTISLEDIDKLTNLMNSAIANNQGELIEVFDQNQFVGAGFFLKDKYRITYLKSACTEDAKKNGAMYGLINYAINRYKPDFRIFDFGGSDIKNVANFYKKFGSLDRCYYNYQVENLPAWFKALKQLKK